MNKTRTYDVIEAWNDSYITLLAGVSATEAMKRLLEFAEMDLIVDGFPPVARTDDEISVEIAAIVPSEDWPPLSDLAEENGWWHDIPLEDLLVFRSHVAGV